MNKKDQSSFHHKRTSCRVCGNRELHKFLALGSMPLANAFLKSLEEIEDEKSYPLDVFFCPNCSLVQLLDVIDPAEMFQEYVYLSGTSATLRKHNKDFARFLVDFLALNSESLVVEIGSNDGSLLKGFNKRGIQTLGVEPATNIAHLAMEEGIETINRFFNFETATQISREYGRAQAVIANNVLAHVDDPLDFLRGCKKLLTEDGLVVVEVPYLRHLLDRLEYDTIYHEHHSYFSVNSLLHLYSSIGLSIIRIDHLDIHGGSIRVFAGLPENYGAPGEEILQLAQEEINDGLRSKSRYDDFSVAVEKNRDLLLQLLLSLKEKKKSIAGYSAPAKGNTLLNYCEVGTEFIPYTVDQNPLKVGLFTPGMHIPVLPASTVLEKQPDYLLILAWNFADEIIEQQREYQGRGGRFIIPIPSSRVI